MEKVALVGVLLLSQVRGEMHVEVKTMEKVQDRVHYYLLTYRQSGLQGVSLMLTL